VSIILDALKKLEGKRIPETTGEILSGSGHPTHRPAKRALWLWSLVGILIVNTSILTVWLILRENVDQPAREEPPAVTASPPVEIPDESVPAVERRVTADAPGVLHRPPSSERILESEVRKTVEKEPVPSGREPQHSVVEIDTAGEIAGEGGEVGMRTPPPVLPDAADATAPSTPAMVETPPAAGGDKTAVDAEENRPSATEEPVLPEDRTYLFAQLPPEIRDSLKDLKIVVHVYSEDAALRMLSVGQGLSREGDTVLTGVRLEEITPDGADFSYRGYRFSLEGH